VFKLTKHKPAQWAFAALALFYGFAFFVAGISGLQAMAPQDYGDLAVSFEIEAMAGIQLTSAMMLAFGLLFNGRWRWSSALRMVGAVILAALCLMLAWSACGAPNGWPVAIYCGGFAVFGLVVAWWNLVDLRAAILWWHDGKAV